jgi:hypothetical protein
VNGWLVGRLELEGAAKGGGKKGEAGGKRLLSLRKGSEMELAQYDMFRSKSVDKAELV